MTRNIQAPDNKPVAGKALANATIPVPIINSHVRMEFTLKAPLTEANIKRLTETAVDIESACKVVKNLRVSNKLGLHARALTVLMKKVESLKSSITIEKDGEPMRLDSIIDMMMNAVEKGAKLKLVAENRDLSVLRKEIDDLLSICDANEEDKIFEPITVDIADAKEVQIKINMINDKIEAERSTFMNLIAGAGQHYSEKGNLSEGDLKEIASQFRALANVKGIRNDILKLYNMDLSKPEMALEVCVKESDTALHIIGKGGLMRKIEARNVPEDLVAQFNHEQISKPIDEFSDEMFKVLNGSHAYEVTRMEQNLTAYYSALEEFLNASALDFNTSFRKVLKARMRYEHHKFIGIRHKS